MELYRSVTFFSFPKLCSPVSLLPQNSEAGARNSIFIAANRLESDCQSMSGVSALDIVDPLGDKPTGEGCRAGH